MLSGNSATADPQAALPSVPLRVASAAKVYKFQPAESAKQSIQDAWFVNEVLPLEPLLVGYLSRHVKSGHGAGEVADIRQDIFVRAYEAASRQLPQDTRSFLFAIARNLLIDHARRAGIVAIDTIDDEQQMIEWVCAGPSPDQVLSGRQELKLLQQALEQLPRGCRQVVELRKVSGLSQREVASQLGIAENTVENQVSKGMRLLANYLSTCGVDLAWSQWARRRSPQNKKTDGNEQR